VKFRRIVDCSRLIPGRVNVVGPWIRNFGWQIMATSRAVTETTDATMHILLHASRLHKLSLPHGTPSGVLALALHRPSSSLRSLCVGISAYNICEAAAIGQCHSLRELAVFSFQVDWGGLAGWALPCMQHLMWFTDGSINSFAFLDICHFPALTRFTLDIVHHRASEEAQILPFMRRHPALFAVAIHVPQAWYTHVLPHVAVHTLSLDCIGLCAAEMIPLISPGVHTLELCRSDKDLETVYAVLEGLLTATSRLRRVRISFDVFRARLGPAHDFAWGQMSSAFRPQLAPEERERQYNELFVRLFRYARRLSEQGIALLDGQDRTVTVLSPTDNC
jgi:hypothetical protein